MTKRLLAALATIALATVLAFGHRSLFAAPNNGGGGSETRSCHLTDARIAMLRSETYDREGAATEKVGTLVRGEAYSIDSAAPIPDTQLCLSESGECTTTEDDVYISAGASTRTLTLCDADSTGQLQVALKVSDQIVTDRPSQPVAMTGSFKSSELQSGAVEVSATVRPLIDRALLWLAVIDGEDTREILWTSEENPGSVSMRENSLRGRVPASALARCPHDQPCYIVMQVVHLARGVADSSAGRSVSISEAKWQVLVAKN